MMYCGGLRCNTKQCVAVHVLGNVLWRVDMLCIDLFCFIVLCMVSSPRNKKGVATQSKGIVGFPTPWWMGSKRCDARGLICRSRLLYTPMFRFVISRLVSCCVVLCCFVLLCNVLI